MRPLPFLCASRFLQRYVQKETEHLQSSKATVSATTLATRQKKLAEICSLVKYFIRCANKRKRKRENPFIIVLLIKGCLIDATTHDWARFLHISFIWVCDKSKDRIEVGSLPSHFSQCVFCLCVCVCVQVGHGWSSVSCWGMWWRCCRAPTAAPPTERSTAVCCSRTSSPSGSTGVMSQPSSGRVSGLYSPPVTLVTDKLK